MALITTNRLFIDVEMNRAYSEFGSFNVVTQPFFVQGDQCPVEISLVRQTGVQEYPFELVPFDAGWYYNLKIGNTTLVATSTASAVMAANPNLTCTSVVAYAPNAWQTYKVSLDAAPFKGFFTLSDATNLTKPIPVTATALNVRDALIEFGGLYTASSVSVQKTGQYSWEVSFLCNTFGASVALISYPYGIVSYEAKVMTLDMTTAGVTTLLDGAQSVEATLEFSVNELSGDTQTFLFTPCTVLNDL